MKSRRTFVFPENGDIILPKTTRHLANDLHRNFVTTDSPKYLKTVVWQIALYMERELHCDFVPFTTRDPESIYDEYYVYIWHKHSGWEVRCKPIELIFGAACFGFAPMREGASGKWSLDWVWLHPYERNRKHLTTAWSYFLETFGDFRVEPPYSHAMKAFLNKHMTHGQRKWVGGID